MAGDMRHGRVLLIAAALLALLNIGMWTVAHLWRGRVVDLAIPIAVKREIRVNIWTPQDDHTSMIANHALAHQVAGPVTIALWYQNRGTATMSRVALVPLPAWPFLLIAVSMALASSWLWRCQRPPA